MKIVRFTKRNVWMEISRQTLNQINQMEKRFPYWIQNEVNKAGFFRKHKVIFYNANAITFFKNLGYVLERQELKKHRQELKEKVLKEAKKYQDSYRETFNDMYALTYAEPFTQEVEDMIHQKQETLENILKNMSKAYFKLKQIQDYENRNIFIKWKYVFAQWKLKKNYKKSQKRYS